MQSVSTAEVSRKMTFGVRQQAALPLLLLLLLLLLVIMMMGLVGHSTASDSRTGEQLKTSIGTLYCMIFTARRHCLQCERCICHGPVRRPAVRHMLVLCRDE